jgi:CRISPR system Cascade subunit CasA
MMMNTKGKRMSDMNRFNLVDEPWISIIGSSPISLRQMFEKPGSELGGNPIQKIALLKLLLAIAQAAYTPKDDYDWHDLGVNGMAKHCLAYLDKWQPKFWLYGPEPFLQMPAIQNAKKVSFGAVMPEIATGNTTLFTQSQTERPLGCSEKAILIVTMMGFALGGKRTDQTFSLSPGHVKKTSKPGTNLGSPGYLHHFLAGRDCLESLWFNLLTLDGIQRLGYRNNVGIPPWEKMPQGETCPRSETLKNSLMGRLVPLSRFCLLSDSGLHYSDGITHLSHREGGKDPSVAINYSSQNNEALYADPSKRPWRWLSSMLGFLSTTNKSLWDCPQLSQGLTRVRESNPPTIGIWSAGLKSRNTSGEQKVSGTDDFVESKIELQSNWLDKCWFNQLESQMAWLEELSGQLKKSVRFYFKEQKADGTMQANKAESLYWQFCEKKFHDLVEACYRPGSEDLDALRQTYVNYARSAFDNTCPADTARQLDAWSKHRFNVDKFANKNTKKKHGTCK